MAWLNWHVPGFSLLLQIAEDQPLQMDASLPAPAGDAKPQRVADVLVRPSCLGLLACSVAWVAGLARAESSAAVADVPCARALALAAVVALLVTARRIRCGACEAALRAVLVSALNTCCGTAMIRGLTCCVHPPHPPTVFPGAPRAQPDGRPLPRPAGAGSVHPQPAGQRDARRAADQHGQVSALSFSAFFFSHFCFFSFLHSFVCLLLCCPPSTSWRA